MQSPQLPRWLTPRFSLRTTFVLVTLCAIFVGWQVRWIKQRRDFLKTQATPIVDPNISQPSAPWLLWIWAEQGYSGLTVHVPADSDWSITGLYALSPEVEEARNLFPECGFFRRVRTESAEPH